jgi:lipoprotein-anchoring transpeptidase ErfK/SrfK
MLWARSLLLIGLASVAVSANQGRAQSLFPFPFPFSNVPVPQRPGAASLAFPSAPSATPQSQGYLPPDADPNYSTPGGFDKDVDFNVATRKEVNDPTRQPPGTITINTGERKLYLSLGDGRAIQYGIGVGRQGFSWKGVAEVGRKAFWPGWTPPPEMLARQPELPDHMDGGMANPLGARALYLFEGNKDTLFRIHGTNEPKSIGHAVSSGCIRMLDSDVIDLYQRVGKGTRVVVL